MKKRTYFSRSAALQISLFFLLSISASGANGVGYTISPDTPANPNTPVIRVESPSPAQTPNGQNETRAEESQPQEKEEPQTRLVKVTLELGTGDRLQGSIEVPLQAQFSHHKNGLTYVKSVSPEELKSVRILSYRIKHRHENEESAFYEFEPDEIEITLTNRKTYLVSHIFPFLRKIEITTTDGTTVLYTFFADSFLKESGWEEVASDDPNYHRTNPHPQAVRAVFFTGAP